MKCALVLCGAAAAVLLVAGGASAQTVADPALAVTTVASGLDQPTAVAFVGTNDLLVTEKASGRVRRIVGGVLQAAPVLDLAVNSESERGLLGIAVNGESPRQVFLYYTAVVAGGGDGGAVLENRVERYSWTGSALAGPTVVLRLPVAPGPNHDGGVLLLGPPESGLPGDGRPLYVVIGDLNRNGQLQNYPVGPAPDDTGVIFRLDRNGAAHPANPLFSYCTGEPSRTCTSSADCASGQTCATAVRRYFAYGVRNSFGLALDPVTGSLWDTENGPSLHDEVNRVIPGLNSGWERIMGPIARNTPVPGPLLAMPGSTYSEPEFTWRDTNAPTGIVFPRASTLGASYDSVALVGDSNLGNLYRFPLNAARTAFELSAFPGLGDLVADSQTEANQLLLGSGFAGIVDLEQGPDGGVYVVSIGAGAVYRIAARAPTPTRTTTPVPPTVTPVPPTATPVPPTLTPAPTSTEPPPTRTPRGRGKQKTPKPRK